MKTFIVLAAIVAIAQAGAFTKLIQCATDATELAATYASCVQVGNIAAASDGAAFFADNSADVKASVNAEFSAVCDADCIGEFDSAQAAFFQDSDCESIFGTYTSFGVAINSVGFACTTNSNGDYCVGAQVVAYQFFVDAINASTACPILASYDECLGTIIARNEYLISAGINTAITLAEYQANVDALIAACKTDGNDIEPATQESATPPFSSSSVAQVGVVALVASAVAALVL
eukprot:m.51519 g.51519  ORF g.51519 m.51519 type:complete len:234 (+) comp11240_c0_seq1:152-853(+)